MKSIFIFICAFYILGLSSQELETITLSPPEVNTTKDLSFLKDELNGKSLVMLGEQTHMYGNIFEMKARLVEYLHQELGFTTIAMESSMYDLWKMNKIGFSEERFNKAVWGVWSGTLEFQRLVKYINANKVKVIGFDSQIMNSLEFIDDFYGFLDKQNIEINLDEDDLGIVIEAVLENNTFDEDDIEFIIYDKELKRIINQIEKLNKDSTNYYWKQFAKSLLACSQDAYYNKAETLSTDFGNKNDNIRDKQMADNLLSYIQRNPDEKIICWADNVHVINDNSSVKKPIAKEFISMGFYIHKALGSKSYSLATIHANDSLYDSGTKIWHSTPIQTNSFESELKEKNEPYLFISSNQTEMKKVKSTRLLNFIDFTEVRLDQLHDGYIFIDKATLPKKEIKKDSTRISKNKLNTLKKVEQIVRGQNVRLKGRILDKETGEPIPFATLIMKKEEIYRVADENGYYELPVKKATLEKASVDISSLGFHTKTILLKNLKKDTFLKPKFEELDEVVITGFLSPKTVLEKAILNKSSNHPVEPFNFHRYAKIINNVNDSNVLDLELITKDYDEGYLSPYRITNEVKQVKWNTNNHLEKKWDTYSIIPYRQNSIRYSNILHKRKFKKFDLKFVKSNEIEDNGLYVIAFETERNKWNYTNRGYPTKYSGRVYINRENFAIIKVVENWESQLNKEEIEKYLKGRIAGNFENAKEILLKEEHICTYDKIDENGKYYAKRFFNRRYSENLDVQNKEYIGVFERDSHFFDFELNDVEYIEYEHKLKDKSSLDRVEYDKSFWDSFKKHKINLK